MIDPFLRVFRELPRRARRWSLGLVLLCGSALGYYVFHTFASPLHRQYQLDFDAAQWIEPAEFAPVAYFRREIFLSAAPEQAWLEIAATDSFVLIVNGHRVGNESSLKTRIAQIYDIKEFLNPGTNVIAISVTRYSYPGSAQLLVCGGFRETGGGRGSFVSDENWRVTPKTGIVQGTEEWSSPLVQEQVWPNAQRATIIEHPVHITWVDTNPLLLRLPPSGKWIVAENATPEAVFSASVNAERARPETWIQVASSGSLDLLVNGKLIVSATTSAFNEPITPRLPPLTIEPSEKGEPTPIPAIVRPPENGKPMPTPRPSASPFASPSASPTATATPVQSPIASRSMTALLQKPTLEAYDISYWIKKGPNTIVAAVRNEQGSASFLASGFMVRKNGTIQQFETNSDWQVREQQSVQAHGAVETGINGSAPWGCLTQRLGKPANLSDFDMVAKPLAVLLLAIVGTIAVWLLTSRFVAAARNEPLRYALARDALFHAPITVGLLFLLLPKYDIRFPIDWPFQPKFVALAVVAFLAVRLLHAVSRWRITADLRARIRQIKNTVSADALSYLLLAAIIGLGFALRYHDFSVMSFDHDEYYLIGKSKGIWELGFPFSRIAGEIIPLTTYELVPYPMALTGLIFGVSEWSMRLPSCLMGTLCIGIIALMGHRLFNWRTGLTAALIYACLPTNIRYAQNCFYPQQCQFMAMLTFWLFYEAIRDRPLHRKYLTAASVAFCAAYLSWEGSAFILLALFLALLVVRWGEWWWVKEFHLYRCVFFMAMLVIAQFSWRLLASDRYLLIGFSKALAGPALFFLQYGWQPMYYVNCFLLSENHVFFTLVTLAGIAFCWRQPAFRYVVTVLAALVFCHTNFIAALSPRYFIYYQPLLILAGVAATVTLYDRLLSLARREGDSAVARSFAHAAGVAMLFLLFIQSNESLMKLYSLSSGGAGLGLMTRMNTYRYDYRGAAQYVKSHFQPGDLIIVGMPHVFEYYAGMSGDYYIDTILTTKITYSEKFAEPRFRDKFRGYPTIRDLKELREVTSRGRRTWLISVPYSPQLDSPEAGLYLNEYAKVVFESYRAKVLLIGGESQPVNVAAGYDAE
jgi:4-amino-4-deoxy-L-arabinose transferase-like glycosyltransferase